MQFNTIVNNIFKQLVDHNSNNNEDDTDDSNVDVQHTIPITWTWVCSNLTKLLIDHPEGITKSIIRSELQKKWDLTSHERLSLGVIDQTREKLPPVSSFFRKNDIPFDMIVDSIVLNISLLIDHNQDLNNNNNNDNDQDNSPINQYILEIGNLKSSIKLLLHPKYNQYVNNLISINSRIKMIGIITNYERNLNDESYGKLKIVVPENMCIVHDDRDVDLGSSIMCHENYYNIDRFKQIYQQDNDLIGDDSTSVSSLPLYESMFLLNIESMDECSLKVMESKWNNIIPYDRHIFEQYLLKQSIYLNDPFSFNFSPNINNNANNSNGNKNQQKSLTIQLVFWDSLCKTIKLLNQGDTIILQYLFFNQSKSDMNRIVLEFTSESTIIILPSTSKLNNNNNKYFDTIINNGISNLDMSLYKNQLKISNLLIGMINISLIAKILFIGKNTQTSNIPIVIGDDSGTITLLLLDDMIGMMIPNLRIGQTCFFKNLYLLETDGKKRLYACLESNSFIQPLGCLPGVINSSSFLFSPVQSIQQLQENDTSCVRATIQECILFDTLPLYAYHVKCKRLLVASKVVQGQFECSHCQSLVQPDEMAKLFHLSFRIRLLLNNNNGNNKNNQTDNDIIVSCSLPTLNRQILGISESSFESLSPQNQQSHFNKLISRNQTYLFTISTIKEKSPNNNVYFRIDGFVES